MPHGSTVEAPSVDTIIADAIGTRTRFRSLEVSCTGDPLHSQSRRSASAINPGEVSPVALYTRIFGPDFADPNAATFTPDPRIMAKRSALSVVAEERRDFMADLGAADKARMDEYFTALRELEAQLALELEKPAPLEACSKPAEPGALPAGLVIDDIVGSFASANAGNGIAVGVTGYALSGGKAGNYVLQAPAGVTANIVPKTLTVGQVTANDKSYDATTAATLVTGGAVLNGVVGSDNVTLNVAGATGVFGQSNVGTDLAVTTSGFTLGGVVGGLITAAIIPSLGWRAVFYIGGAIPLVLGLLMWISLPESIQFLMFRKSDNARIRKQLLRVAPGADVPVGAQFVLDEQKAKGVPFIELFKDGRARVTLLLWVINFANLLDMYFLSNWLPTVIRDAGYSTQVAVMAGTALWAGGVIGTLLLGRVIDRVGFTSVLAVTFLIAIAATAAIGNPVVMVSMVAVFIAIFFAGFSIIGGQPALNALAATYYPTSLRSTGIGWSLGVGRIGSVLGPVLGGALMHLQWSSSSLFLAAAVPACVSLIGVLAIARSQRGDRGNLRTATAG